jgi:hypothetical protein
MYLELLRYASHSLQCEEGGMCGSLSVDVFWDCRGASPLAMTELLLNF